MRLPIHSLSQTQGKNYTVSELHHHHVFRQKHIFYGKMIVTASKRHFFYIFTVQLVMSQLDGEVFPDFCGEKTKLGVLQNIN